MVAQFNFQQVISLLEEYVQECNAPVKELHTLNNAEPFKVLISTLISLRTKDEVTIAASKRVFQYLKKPSDIDLISEHDLEQMIYPAGFYKTKARKMRLICKRLVTHFDGKVPNTLTELLSFDGIGLKSANLILSEGFNLPAICVDTHVHRISNRLGFLRTKTPEDTEGNLKLKLPQHYWIRYNFLLVAFGQTLCKPISPFCSKCPIKDYCKRIGVTTKR
jgi:endonuclease-3